MRLDGFSNPVSFDRKVTFILAQLLKIGKRRNVLSPLRVNIKKKYHTRKITSNQMQDFCPIIWSPDPCLNPSGFFHLSAWTENPEQTHTGTVSTSPRVSPSWVLERSVLAVYYTPWPIDSWLWSTEALSNSAIGGICSNWLSDYFLDGWRACTFSSLWLSSNSGVFLFRNLEVLGVLPSPPSLNCHCDICIFLLYSSSVLQKWLVPTEVPTKNHSMGSELHYTCSQREPP